MSVTLFHRILGEGQPLFILHGLFGSSDNWQTHAKALSEPFQVILVDQRNHGHSPHHDEMNYDVMADDLYALMQNLNCTSAHFICHSIGGKTVMRLAQKHPQVIHRMIVADMGIRAYPPHHDVVFQGLFHVDAAHCHTRKEAEERLSAFVEEMSTRQFLMKNLYWIEPGKLAWRFNLPVLSEQREFLMAALPTVTTDAQTLFLTGGKSHYVKQEEYESILRVFPQATFQEMPLAGHWLHAEDPQGFMQHAIAYLTMP
ncbi:MAG: alpha/beta fold hydrolase [Flavobacteriales bacterium]